MKPIKLIIAILIGASVILAGCSSNAPAEVKAQTADVQRGDLSIEITASGNLALSLTQDCAFEIASYVAELLIEEGDYVKKGQVLARLDDTAWKTNLRNLEDRVTSAKRTVTAKERDLATSQLNLQTAEYNLLVMDDVKKANDAVKDAQDRLKIAEMKLLEAAGAGVADTTYAGNYWRTVIVNMRQEIAEKQKTLNDVLSDHSTTLSADVNSQVALKKAQVDMAKAKLEDANIAIQDARNTVKNAQDDLDEANKKKTYVEAPFDGFVTKVPVIGGQEIFKGAVAATVADLTKFEASVLVSEKDVFSVKEEGGATISVDAMPGVAFPAKITRISPTATIQSGVVNYKVKVELDTTKLAESAQTGQSSRSLAQGQRPGATGSSGGQSSQSAGSRQLPASLGSGMQAQVSGTAQQQASLLREGMTITVNIPLARKNNVVMVPNRALARQGRDTTVQVTKDGVVSSRIVKTGINNTQNTEITEGLTEGEMVVLQQTPASTQQSNQFRFGGMGIPAPPPGAIRK